MNMSRIRSWINANEPFSAVLAIAAIVLSLQTVESTGIPASIRGTETYNTLTVPTHSAAPGHEESEGDVIDERSWDFRERVCERIVNRFANDANTWARVSERVQKRFGFLCSK
jgi:hypothetical protein